ncbi:MAG: hypothetical protein ABEI32_14985 [Halothece sp.]
MTPEDKHELRQMIRQEIESALEQIKPEQTSQPQYLPTRKAAQALGYTNVQPLYRAIENGLFRIGKEVQDRRNPHSCYSNYYFNIPACQKRLNSLPEKRKS